MQSNKLSSFFSSWTTSYLLWYTTAHIKFTWTATLVLCPGSQVKVQRAIAWVLGFNFPLNARSDITHVFDRSNRIRRLMNATVSLYVCPDFLLTFSARCLRNLAASFPIPPVAWCWRWVGWMLISLLKESCHCICVFSHFRVSYTSGQGLYLHWIELVGVIPLRPKEIQ